MQTTLRKFSGPYDNPEPKIETSSESESLKDLKEKEKEKDKKIYEKNLQKDWSPLYPNISLLSYSFKPFGLNYGAFYSPFC